MQRVIKKVKDIWNRETNSFGTFGDLVLQYNMAPTRKHESKYRIILGSVTVDMNLRLWERQDNEEDRNTSFSIIEHYELTERVDTKTCMQETVVQKNARL